MASKELEIAGYNLLEIMRSENVASLSELANLAADQGSKLSSLAYMAAYRIYTIYMGVERADNATLIRHLQMAKGIVADPKIGSTGLRRLYNEQFHGWASFDAWVSDWASGAPISRSSARMKVIDISGWREEGCDWPTIFMLLSRVPMAGREALDKPVKHEALPPAPETGEPSKAQYLKELTTLAPGEARAKVSRDAGEPQIYVTGASLNLTEQYGKALLLDVRVETSSGVEDYNIAIHPIDVHDGWGAVAYWISRRLGKAIKVG